MLRKQIENKWNVGEILAVISLCIEISLLIAEILIKVNSHLSLNE